MTNTKSNWRAKRRTKRLIVITSLVLAVALTIGLTFAFWNAGIDVEHGEGRFGIQIGHGEAVDARINLDEQALHVSTAPDITAVDAEFTPIDNERLIPRAIPLFSLDYTNVWAMRFYIDLEWELDSDDPSLEDLAGILNYEAMAFWFEIGDTNPFDSNDEEELYEYWNEFTVVPNDVSLTTTPDVRNEVDVLDFSGYTTWHPAIPPQPGVLAHGGRYSGDGDLFNITVDVARGTYTPGAGSDPGTWGNWGAFTALDDSPITAHETVRVRVTITMNIPANEAVYALISRSMGDLVLRFSIELDAT